MPDKLMMPSLREAMWSSSPDPNATLDDVLKAVAPTGSVAGIAYTTAGAHAITSVSDGKLHSSGGDVERAAIYELRLWEVGITDDREVLAHEALVPPRSSSTKPRVVRKAPPSSSRAGTATTHTSNTVRHRSRTLRR